MPLKSKINITRFFSWLTLFGVVGFYIFELLPSKGITYRDEGWTLYSAWAAVTPDVPLDTLEPQQTAFFLNGALILLGAENYYAFRLIFHFLILAAFFIYFSGIYDKNEKLPPIFPLLAAIGLFCTRSTVISYQNTPILLFLCSFGLFFNHLKADHRFSKRVLLTLSAFCLGLSGVINIIVTPASALTCAALLLSCKKNFNKCLFVSVYALTIAAPLSWYIHEIGLNEFFRVSAYHSIWGAIAKIPSVVMFAIHWGIAYGVLFLLVVLGIKMKIAKEINKLDLGLALMFVTVSFHMILILDMSIFGLNIVETLSIDWIKSIDIDWHLKSWDLNVEHLLGCLSVAIIWLALFSCYKNKESHKRLLQSLALLFVYFIGQLSSSHEKIVTYSINFAGPLLVIAILFFYDSLAEPNGFKKSLRRNLFCISFGMIFILGLYVQTHYPLHAQPYWKKRDSIDAPKLQGLREYRKKRISLERSARIYDQHRCSDKEFIALENIPVLYYMFERKATGRSSWIRNHNNYPEKEIFETLKSKRGSCVFLSRSFDIPEYWKDYGKALRLLKFLSEKSDHMVEINLDPDPWATSRIYIIEGE